MKKFKSILALLLLGGLVVTGCGKKDKKNSNKPSGGDQQQPSGDQGGQQGGEQGGGEQGGGEQQVTTYTITFKNYDDSVLETKSVEEGQMPSYTGTTPEKAGNAQYSYTFDGWEPELAVASADATYTAKFIQGVNSYTVRFVNDDGTELQSETLEYGAMPEYKGATPTKLEDAQYTYTFKGWDNEIAAVEGNATYTATYNNHIKQYTIRFLDEDSTVLETKQVNYGDVPAYTGATPTKEQTAQYTYSFTGWSPEVVAVTGNADYVAQYGANLRNYTITFKNEGGDVLESKQVPYGTTPSYTGPAPTKDSTVQYEYSFAGWSPALAPVDGEAVYTATFNENVRSYTIKFVNYNGDVLQEGSLEYGQTPSYTGSTPTKESSVSETYTFKGWDNDIATVTGDATYTATYNSAVRQYTITWIDGNGNELKSEQVDYGDTPVYTGEDPTKTKTAEHTYTWDGGWTVDPAPVEGDATYYASFNDSKTLYTVKLLNSDDSLYRYLAEPVAYDAVVDLSAEKPDYPADPSLDTDISWTELPRDEENFIRTFKAAHDAVGKCTKASYFRYTFINENTECRVDGFYGSLECENLIIPSSIEGKPVTQITNYAFYGEEVLKTVHLPETVTYIGYSAFYGCRNIETFICDGAASMDGYACFNLLNCHYLEVHGHNGDAYEFESYGSTFCGLGNDLVDTDVEVVFGEGLKTIPEFAFDSASITSINIPKSVTEIKEYAFRDCEHLKTCEVGIVENEVRKSNLESIGDWAFANTPELGEVFIPSSVTSIGEHAFCESGISGVVIPAGCSLDYGCFSECPNLGRVEILNDMTVGDINSYAYFEWSGVSEFVVSPSNTNIASVDGVIYSKDLTKLLLYPACKEDASFTVPAGVVQICQNSFERSQHLISVDLNQVTDLEYGAFIDSSIEAVDIPNTVLDLPGKAFYGSQLKSVYIHEDIDYIYSSAFGNCRELETITVDPGNSDYKAEDAILFNFAKTELFTFSANKTGSYTVPSTITHIGEYSFSGTQLSSVNLNNVEFLGNNAFEGSGEITVDLGKADRISSYCFAESGIKNIELKSTITAIDGDAFIYSDIESIELNDECERIGTYAFYECFSLTNVDLNKVQQIGGYAFYRTSITSIYVPDTVTYIGCDVFEYCEQLVTAEFHCDLVLANNCVSYDEHLETLIFGDEVVFIDQYFAYGCTRLTTLTFGDHVELIDNYAFEGCFSLEEITLPASINGLMNGVFSNCDSLATINYEGTIAQFAAIGEYRYDEEKGRSYGIIGGWTGGDPVEYVTCSDGPCALYPFE